MAELGQNQSPVSQKQSTQSSSKKAPWLQPPGLRPKDLFLFVCFHVSIYFSAAVVVVVVVAVVVVVVVVVAVC